MSQPGLLFASKRNWVCMIKSKRTNNGKWRFWYSGPQPEPQTQTVSQNYHPTLDGAITLPTPSVQTLLLELLLCWNWKLGCCCFLCRWHKKKKKKKLCDENTTLVRWSRLTSTVISHVDSMSPSADMMETALSLWSAFPKLITWTYSWEEHQGNSNRWASHKIYDQYSSKL